jgi:hypothetical protein
MRRNGLNKVSLPFDWIGDNYYHSEDPEPPEVEELISPNTPTAYPKMIEEDFKDLWKE